MSKKIKIEVSFSQHEIKILKRALKKQNAWMKDRPDLKFTSLANWIEIAALVATDRAWNGE
jgi:hypothetical protein